jgi:hypothetical protein
MGGISWLVRWLKVTGFRSNTGGAMQEIIEVDPAWSVQFFLKKYIKPDRSGLIPNVTLVQRDAHGTMVPFIKTNAWGFKGNPPDPSKKQAVIWGDSVVFGIGPSWAEMLSQDQDVYQFHNGGLEGDIAINVMNRMIEGNKIHPLALNVLFLGWHGNASFKTRYFSNTLNTPDDVELMLVKIVKTGLIPGLILCTLPTYLCADDAQQDFSHLFSGTENYITDDDAFFTFWGQEVYDPANIQFLLAFIADRNAIIRRVAHTYGIPLIDLYELFKVKTVEEGRASFCDVCHFRSRMYPHIRKVMMTQFKAIQGVFT